MNVKSLNYQEFEFLRILLNEHESNGLHKLLKACLWSCMSRVRNIEKVTNISNRHYEDYCTIWAWRVRKK